MNSKLKEFLWLNLYFAFEFSLSVLFKDLNLWMMLHGEMLNFLSKRNLDSMY